MTKLTTSIITLLVISALSAQLQGIQIQKSDTTISIESYQEKGYLYTLKNSNDLKEWQTVAPHTSGNDAVVRISLEVLSKQEFFKFEVTPHYAPIEVDARIFPKIESTLIDSPTNQDWIRLDLDINGSFHAPGIINESPLTLSGWWQWRHSDDTPNRMILQLTMNAVVINGESVSIDEAAQAIGRALPTSVYSSIEYLSEEHVTIINQIQTTDGQYKVTRSENLSFKREVIYLILAMGQSNMVASSAPGTIQPYPELDSDVLLNISSGTELNASEGTIREASSETNGEWTTSDQRLESYGLERAFARRLANEGNNVAIAKWARNGKNIARWNDHTGSSYYDVWTAWYHLRISELHTMGYDVRPIFLWSQGSADCTVGRGASYQDELTELIETVRLLSRAPTPTVIGRTYRGIDHPEIPTNFSLTDYAAVRTAQSNVGELSGNTWYDRDSMEFRDGHTHFQKSEYQREGSDLAFTSYWNAFSEY